MLGMFAPIYLLLENTRFAEGQGNERSLYGWSIRNEPERLVTGIITPSAPPCCAPLR